MTWEPIGKPAAIRGAANLTDHSRTCREFSWEAPGRRSPVSPAAGA